MNALKTANKTIAIALGLFLLWGLFSPTAWAQDLDVYIVYSGKNKKDQKQLKGVLPQNLTVKSYNVDLLVLADYSGKQKVIAKLGRARVIVILHDRPMEILEGSKVKTNLLVVKSAKGTVNSEGWTLHVVSKGTALTGKALEAAKEGDLGDTNAIRAAKVVFVDEGALDIFKAVSLIVEKVLSS